jgi:hypothetical protein
MRGEQRLAVTVKAHKQITLGMSLLPQGIETRR